MHRHLRHRYLLASAILFGLLSASSSARDAKKLNDGPPQGKTRETRSVQRQINHFQTDLPFSLDTERRRLVDAHSPVPEAAEQ